MAPKTQKRHRSPHPESQPTKKAKGKADGLTRRSDRSGKGTGGAAKQLRKAGDAVASQSKRRLDAFEDAGEGLNPMAPESLPRKSKKVTGVNKAYSHILKPSTLRARNLLRLLTMTMVAHSMYSLPVFGRVFANYSSLPGRTTIDKTFSPEKQRQIWAQIGA